MGNPIEIAADRGEQNLAWVAFDGVKVFVNGTDWSHDADHDGTCDATEGTCWDVAGRWVSPAGALVGSAVPLVTDDGNQVAGISAFSGRRQLMLWMDLDSLDGDVGDVLASLRTRPGGTTPRGTPDGKIAVADVVLALRFATQLEAPPTGASSWGVPQPSSASSCFAAAADDAGFCPVTSIPSRTT